VIDLGGARGFDRLPGLVELVQAVQSPYEIQPGCEELGIESYRFAKRFDRLPILPQRQ